MKYKFIILILFLNVSFVIAQNVYGSVTCDFGSGFSVQYSNGEPTPTQAACNLTIVNDESHSIDVNDLTIDSTSMAFVSLGSGGSGWLCSYQQLTSPPNFTGRTICVPNSSISIEPGNSVSFDMNFSFEDTTETTNNAPDYIGLTDIVVNGTEKIPQDADLGELGWNVNVVDENNENSSATGKVKGYIYFDDNDNDKRDKGEEGVEDVKMKLKYAGADNKMDTDDDKKYADRTNKEGKYHFDDLLPGRYRLKVDDGQMIEFYLTAEKDKVNGKSHFSLDEGETKERDFGYDRDRDAHGNPKNTDLNFLRSGFGVSSIWELVRNVLTIK